MQRFCEERERLEILDPSQALIAVVDMSGVEPTRVAYVRWHLPSSVIRDQQVPPADSSTKDELDSGPMHLRENRPPPPNGTNIPLYTTFVKALAKIHNRCWDYKRDYSKLIYSYLPP